MSDLFRLPQPPPSSQVESRSGDTQQQRTGPDEVAEALKNIAPALDPAKQDEIRATCAEAKTTRCDGYLRLVLGPVGAAVALVAELPVLPVLGVVAAGVWLTSRLDQPVPTASTASEPARLLPAEVQP